VLTAMNPVIFFFSCGRADAEFVYFSAAHFSTTSIILPAILFHDT
jgi:hypothetical protein